MKSIENLFQFIMRNERTIVYGNLGRKYHMIYEYIIKELPTFEVIVESKYYKLFSRDHIHVSSQSAEKCDLYIFIEPEPESLIIHPKLASKVVIFTSHLLSKFLNNSFWAFATYFHFNKSKEEEIRATKRLLELQQTSRYLNKLDKIFKHRLDFDEILTVSSNTGPTASANDIILIPGNALPTLNRMTVVIADLTQVTTSGGMFVYLLDIIDFIKENIDKVEYWFVCFPNNNNEKFDYIITKNLDKLFCMNFKYSNVSLPNLILLYPFNKVGTINRCKPCVQNKFCNLNYIAPEHDSDAFSASTLFNLEPLVKNLYIVT